MNKKYEYEDICERLKGIEFDCIMFHSHMKIKKLTLKLIKVIEKEKKEYGRNN